MATLELSWRKQWAVLWAHDGVSFTEDGQPKVDAPVEIRVRWNDKAGNAYGPQGNTLAFDATAIVDRDIVVGSIMWPGSMDEWLEDGSAGSDTGLMEVVNFVNTPDLKGRKYRRTVQLAFYKDEMPELA